MTTFLFGYYRRLPEFRRLRNECKSCLHLAIQHRSGYWLRRYLLALRQLPDATLAHLRYRAVVEWRKTDNKYRNIIQHWSV